ncbi:MAG: PAS domain-containing protein, partial [Gemmatimonadetes bacterium]|nr:PAS domain-containing protein [Gemmatimonadota bacterium]
MPRLHERQDSASATGTGTASSLDSAIFESSPDCVKLLDLEGHVLAMNRNGRCIMEIDDFTRLRGQPWHSLWPAESRGQILGAVESARAGNSARFTAFCPSAKGTPKWWDVTVTAVLDAAGRVASVLSVSRDITELYHAKQSEEEGATRLRFILEAAQVGEWDLDLATGRVRSSPLHDRCFGYAQPPADWSRDMFMAHVHPEDREAVERTVQAALASGSQLRFECRVIWADGSVHWITVLGALYTARDGSPQRLVGTVQDITERKRVEQ